MRGEEVVRKTSDKVASSLKMCENWNRSHGLGRRRVCGICDTVRTAHGKGEGEGEGEGRGRGCTSGGVAKTEAWAWSRRRGSVAAVFAVLGRGRRNVCRRGSQSALAPSLYLKHALCHLLPLLPLRGLNGAEQEATTVSVCVLFGA
jgi:hypothetical protein